MNRSFRFRGSKGFQAGKSLGALSFGLVALLAPDRALAQPASSPGPGGPAAQPAAPTAQPVQAQPAQTQPGTPQPSTPQSQQFEPSPGPAPAGPPTGGNFTPSPTEPRVLISEVAVKGLDGHPEQERLERAVYDAMATRPGTRVSRSELQNDLSAVYATGWFSDVRIQPTDSPLGVKLVVSVAPNPVLQAVELDPPKAKMPASVIKDTFAADYGKTLNLNTLQSRMQELQRWYSDKGFSLARVTGPSRVSPEGVVQLEVREGSVSGVEVQFLNKEGSATNDKGQPIKGKTKPWVVSREISIKPGEVFNRRQLEEDIKRLYATGLFGDVKVTLRPVPAKPGEVVIVLGVVEQSTGSLSGGLGYSQSQGVFGQIQLQDSNLAGRAWDTSFNFTYGQYGGLADISFTDPWIKGDRFRTAFRARLFLSRDVPQIFQSQNNGNFSTVSDVSSNFYQAPSTAVANNIFSSDNLAGSTYSNVQQALQANGALGVNNNWFAFDGNSIAIQRMGGSVQLIRPLNGGDPFKKAPWTVVVGLNAQEVRPMNFSGDSMPYGVTSFNGATTNVGNVICIAYNCASSNQLVGIRLAATRNTLNDPRNPTSGNFLSLGTEQYLSVGPNSPTFNRLRGSYTHFIPVNWLKFYKGCRPKRGETPDCKQALAFQVSAGANIGQLPTYEAFCLGGSNSVRGFYDCNLGVGRSFGEATIEYRFPLFSIVSGELFIDGGTAFGSQKNVPGNPGELLGKPGQGFSVGTGVIVTTPVGPLRLEVASQDFSSNWRFNLGVGWKF
ncbi:BamA/TamA family outer membrane protein [Cyanobium sp. Morenito 9A2]|uniref:BamA/TamA family outer membrane protein n=1 Tax=Cyanobium sp. Morenito 9A2 TaxID=2823718 RepID=UPI0020CCE0DE|nr:BamA/TamA family outer membrane protein [Cyanobium sp. Morenito 9A2]MCP9849083.1 BamA/TamA family outer membrane protein [Cyanobium sp. Morenito 9A2]